MQISLVLLSLAVHTIESVPCVNFNVGTSDSGNNVVSGGDPKNDRTWDADHSWAQASLAYNDFSVSYVGETNFKFSTLIEVVAPNEADCHPEVGTLVPNACNGIAAGTACVLRIKYNCNGIGQVRVKTTITPDSSALCNAIVFGWTRTAGSALQVGTLPSPVSDDVVRRGITAADYVPNSQDTQPVEQNAYVSTYQLYFSLAPGTLPYTKTQLFTRSKITVDVTNTKGTGTVITKQSGDLLAALKTGLSVGDDPKMLNITYTCHDFGISKIMVTVTMQPFATTTFAWSKYCTHITGYSVEAQWHEGTDAKEIYDIAVKDGIVQKAWAPTDGIKDWSPRQLDYSVSDTSFMISNDKEETYFAKPTLEVIAITAGCTPTLGNIVCTGTTPDEECVVGSGVTLKIPVDYGCSADANGYMTLRINIVFQAALSISLTWQKFTGRRPGFSVTVDPSFQYIADYPDTAIVVNGAVPDSSSWRDVTMNVLPAKIVRFPLVFVTTDVEFKMPDISMDLGPDSQRGCSWHIRRPSADEVTGAAGLLEIIFICKSQSQELITVHIKDMLYLPQSFSFTKSNLGGWSGGIGFKMVSVHSNDLSSHVVDHRIAYEDNSPHNAKKATPYDWGFSYGLSTGYPACANAEGKFVGCMVVDRNDIMTRKFSFGYDTSKGPTDCTYSDLNFFTNSTHCQIIYAISNPAGDTNMPSWVTPGHIDISYTCDNKANKMLSVDDVVMVMPLKCEGEDIQSVVVRWVKMSGAVVPDKPDAPTNLKVGDKSVTMDLVIPKGHGNPITSLVVSFGNETSEVTPSGVWDFDEGNTVRYTVRHLHNGDSYTFAVAAVNVAGAGAASGPSVLASPKNPSGGLSVAGIIGIIGAILVVGAIGLYFLVRKRGSQEHIPLLPAAEHAESDYAPLPGEGEPEGGQVTSVSGADLDVDLVGDETSAADDRISARFAALRD